MTISSSLLALAIGLPLALLLCAAISPRLRAGMPAWLPFAPVPALLAAMGGTDGTMLAWGNARFALRFALDAPGAMLLGAAALLWIAAGAVAAWNVRTRGHGGAFVVCWLMALTGCVGVFVAADLVGFYFLLAVLSVGASGLVLQGEGRARVRAAVTYLGVALLAEAVLLPALILLALTTAGSLLIGDGTAALAASPGRDIVIVLLLVGLGIKAGLVPCHVWMPLAYGAAPTAAAAVMSGAIVKAAVLALIRFLPLGTALPQFGLPLAAIGLFGAFYGVAIGITQPRCAHILAYSSVSQMGFMAAILGMGLAAGDRGTGLATAFYATHHLLVKGALFLALGVIAHTGSRHLRWTLVPVAIIALGLGGLPLTGGALAKYAAKDLLGGGLVGAMAALSSVASTVLMIHFLWRLSRETAPAPDARAPVVLTGAWLAMAAASLAAPWALYVAIPSGAMPSAVSASALAGALWPVLAGGLIAAALYPLASRLPRIPPGDIAILLPGGERDGKAGAAGGGKAKGWLGALSAGCRAADDYARRWTVATLAFVLVTLIFAGAFVPSG